MWHKKFYILKKFTVRFIRLVTLKSSQPNFLPAVILCAIQVFRVTRTWLNLSCSAWFNNTELCTLCYRLDLSSSMLGTKTSHTYPTSSSQNPARGLWQFKWPCRHKGEVMAVPKFQCFSFLLRMW